MVGFTACTSEEIIYNIDDVIQFPSIESNFGTYYNGQTGIFLCPYDGVYMFFCSVVGAGVWPGAKLMREVSNMIGMEADVSSTSASNTVISECLRGQRVWVRQRYDDEAVDCCDRSAFSGYLLHRY